MRRNVKLVISLGCIIIILYSAFAFVPTLSDTFEYSVTRIKTLDALVEGDSTAENTLGRITERRPRVINKFKEQPIIGFGFSEEYYEYSDIHIGNETLLLQGGIIGYLLMVILWVTFNLKLLKRNTKLLYTNPFKNSLIVFVIAFLGFFIIHSTSGYIFNYQIRYHSGMAIAIILFFTLADKAYKNSIYNVN